MLNEKYSKLNKEKKLRQNQTELIKTINLFSFFSTNQSIAVRKNILKEDRRF